MMKGKRTTPTAILGLATPAEKPRVVSISGKPPVRLPPSRRCGKCGGVVGPAQPEERECACELVRCVMVDGMVVYLTRAELNLIISARPVEVPGTDLGRLDTGDTRQETIPARKTS